MASWGKAYITLQEGASQAKRSYSRVTLYIGFAGKPLCIYRQNAYRWVEPPGNEEPGPLWLAECSIGHSPINRFMDAFH